MLGQPHQRLTLHSEYTARTGDEQVGSVLSTCESPLDTTFDTDDRSGLGCLSVPACEHFVVGDPRPVLIQTVMLLKSVSDDVYDRSAVTL